MRGRKPKTLTKKQSAILGLLAIYTKAEEISERSIKYWTQQKKIMKKTLEGLWKDAEKERIPITRVAKILGISKVAVHLRYKKFKEEEK